MAATMRAHPTACTTCPALFQRSFNGSSRPRDSNGSPFCNGNRSCTSSTLCNGNTDCATARANTTNARH
eukprot:3842650-Rhodomonas_salina.1